MIKNEIIPNVGEFHIDDYLIKSYCSIYNDKIVGNPGPFKNETSRRYSEKLAGLSLIRLLETRQHSVTKSVKVNSKKIISGFVYIISNPIFKDVYKIGMTRNLENRLKVYQTSDPYRRFKVEHYIFCIDARKIEKDILDKFSIDIANGEWIKADEITNIREYLFLRSLI